MAQKVQIILTDDVDGGEAAETVSFAIDGAAYEIDLSEANAAKLRAALHPFMGGGRRLKAVRGGKATGRSGTGAASVAGQSGDIRAWAREQGIAVNDRGRIPANVIEQYQAAH
ncbi:histone-like nucleoid-structuring protein Lsr2 [Actinomadura violacea]|uniref:Lsr2 family protein n=1 Tax=Actinomadura violacea TaxID=2819934 RepID=A0ABS3RUC0_9ACTN|nr:Lsr2 family protein [Actinomadura violacea]MBO2460355.1 Lsr2 family protein [Actinomadura violacea]